MPLAAAAAVAGQLGAFCLSWKRVACAKGDFNVQELFCFPLFGAGFKRALAFSMLFIISLEPFALCAVYLLAR